MPDAETINTKENFFFLFGAGRNWALVGPVGSGKSSLGLMILLWAIENGFAACGNFVVEQWDRAAGGFRHATVKGLHVVGSWLDFVRLLPNFLRSGKPIILIIDEIFLSTGIGAGQTILMSPVQAVISFFTISRHLNTSCILISQSVDLLTSRLREAADNGLVAG